MKPDDEHEQQPPEPPPRDDRDVEPRSKLARRLFFDWLFPLLVLGAVAAAIVYVLVASGVVSPK